MDERNMLRKDLAEKMKVSASFLTQLFRGDRPVSDYHKAQLARIFKINWEVKAAPMVRSRSKARSMGMPATPSRNKAGSASVAAEPAAEYGRAGGMKKKAVGRKG